MGRALNAHKIWGRSYAWFRLWVDLAQIRGLFVGVDRGRYELPKIRRITDGIMEESNTQHILGCNAYEKFIQAMTELNYDEKWITELKQEVKGLKEENEKLEAKIAKFKKILTDE